MTIIKKGNCRGHLNVFIFLILKEPSNPSMTKERSFEPFFELGALGQLHRMKWT
jgi:hypothetical protein